MDAFLILEDGTIFKGSSIGAEREVISEVVFNTSMTGYLEVLTDPSYAGQAVTMTYPLIGNYGINGDDNQSDKIYASGLVVKEACEAPSNYRLEKSLEAWLKEMGIPGIANIDTRQLTKRIRKHGTVKCVISTEDKSQAELAKLCEESSLRADYMKEASWAEAKYPDYESCPDGKYRVAVLDFGIKKSILDDLKSCGCAIKIFPYGFTAEEVLASCPDGVFLSNGPGDPAQAREAIAEVKKLMQASRADGKALPMFGICLGHQILALAAGGETYKLKYGHRGGNHGVYNKETDRSYITSQNHGYAVKAESMILKNMDVTEVNLNDKTVEGMKHRQRPIFSVQYHPEASPGPCDSKYLFEKFTELMKA